MLAKLKREHARLENEVTGDDLMNFVITGYHIIDWIKNNTSVSSAVTAGVKLMYDNLYIAVCRDLANGSKHFDLRSDYKDRVTDKTSVISGYGTGRFGKGAYGVGEPSIVIVLTDGQRFDALEFAKQVVAAWEDFFAKHEL
ncbi:MAG: hypothetical protein ACT4PJ_02975 [Gemmatimonadaceae bacterium]